MGSSIKFKGEIVVVSPARAESMAYEGDDDFDLWRESDVTDEGKFGTWYNIYQRKSDNKFFIQYNSRSGSYYSDYYYEYGEELYEVEEVETITTEWKRV